MLLPGRPPVVVAAHSIGSYIAVHAIRDAENNTDAGGDVTIPRIAKVQHSAGIYVGDELYLENIDNSVLFRSAVF